MTLLINEMDKDAYRVILFLWNIVIILVLHESSNNNTTFYLIMAMVFGPLSIFITIVSFTFIYDCIKEIIVDRRIKSYYKKIAP